MAQVAWDLQRGSRGRFHLGLGTQVRAHVERRFSMPFDRPAARVTDYVRCVRAIWDTFQNGTRPAYDGEFYRFRLMNPFFDPGPIDHPDIPIYLAGVNERMCRAAGEVADGFHVHPMHSVGYLRNVVRPAIDEGARANGRDGGKIVLYAPAFTVSGETETERSAAEQEVRRQIAFYASTPNYRALLEYHDLGGIGKELSALMRGGRVRGDAAPRSRLPRRGGGGGGPAGRGPGRAPPALRGAPRPGVALLPLPRGGSRVRREALRRLFPRRRLNAAYAAMITMRALIERAERHFPANPAIVPAIGGQGRPLAWSEFAVRVRRAAGALRSLGVRAGDRFAILCRNDPAPGRAHPRRVLDGRGRGAHQLPARTARDRGDPRQRRAPPPRGGGPPGRARVGPRARRAGGAAAADRRGRRE